jgi:S1-C subfamily serine protease
MTQLSRSRAALSGAFLLVLAAGSLMGLATARAADAFGTNSDDVNALFDKAKTAVVKVHSGNGDFRLAGTGFFIDDHGTVLTAASVIGENLNASVEVDGVEMDAKILGNDPRSGLAVLHVNYAQTPFLTLGRSTDLKTGNSVVTIGYPLNLPSAPSQGLISGFEVRYLNLFFSTTHIHANLPISPGQVGGPLLNTRGEVVGLVMPSPDDGKSVYALPVEAMQKIIGDFTQYGYARHGWVGVNVVEMLDTNHDGRTVRVVQAVPGTPASKSGILPGDTVMRIDAREVYRPADVLDASFFSHVGGNMTVVVRRNEQLFNYTFAVIERPQNPGAIVPVTTNSSPLGQPIVVNPAGH